MPERRPVPEPSSIPRGTTATLEEEERFYRELGRLLADAALQRAKMATANRRTEEARQR